MELLEGAQPLDAYVEQAQLRGEATIRLVIQACDGVQAAHAQGIVHRDLKPSNVLVLGSGAREGSSTSAWRGPGTRSG